MQRLKLPTTPALAAYAAGRTIQPLWVSPSGRAFYPIAGGAPDDPPGDGGDGGQGGKPGDGGDGGKGGEPPKFEPITSQEDLDRKLGQRLAREREKFADYDDLKKKAADFDKLQEASKTEAEKAVEAARTQGEVAGREVGNTRLVNAEARALAATAGFRNPNIAVGSIDLAGVKVNEDGSVDVDAIKVKLDDLAKSDPYLIDDGKKRPKPDGSQGGGGEDKPSVTRGADLWETRHPKKTSA